MTHAHKLPIELHKPGRQFYLLTPRLCTSATKVPVLRFRFNRIEVTQVPVLRFRFNRIARTGLGRVTFRLNRNRNTGTNAMGLADQQCIPCRGGVPPLPRERIDALLAQLDTGWSLTASGHLLRTFEFRDFAQALAFANRVGEIAEQQAHHPDLHVGWGRCGVEIWTHKIDGLTESDFFLAAKVDRAFLT